MAALNYPASPTVGQEFDRWVWDGTRWMLAASGSGGGGGGSDGYSFVQDTTPIATVSGQTWYETATGASYVWYDTFWVQTSPGGSSSAAGTRLWASSERAEAMVTANVSYDVVHPDQTVYPYATVARIDISGMYSVPDRATTIGAMLFSNSYYAVGTGSGRIYSWVPNFAAPASAWYALGTMSAVMPIAAGIAGIEWRVRYTTTPGGPTTFGYSHFVTMERFRV